MGQIKSLLRDVKISKPPTCAGELECQRVAKAACGAGDEIALCRKALR